MLTTYKTNNVSHGVGLSTRATGGFTLVELLIVIAIAGILMGLAVPSFVSFMQREKMSAVADEFVSAIYVVRSAAIQSGVPVVLCASDDGSSCGGEWEDGWFAFTDDDRDAEPDPAEVVVLRRQGESNSASISVVSPSGSGVDAVSFNYRGAPDSALSVVVAQGSQSVSMSVTIFGKPRYDE